MTTLAYCPATAQKDLAQEDLAQGGAATMTGFTNDDLRRMAAAGVSKKDLAFRWGWNFYHAKGHAPKVYAVVTGLRRDVGVYVSYGQAREARLLLLACIAAPENDD